MPHPASYSHTVIHKHSPRGKQPEALAIKTIPSNGTHSQINIVSGMPQTKSQSQTPTSASELSLTAQHSLHSHCSTSFKESHARTAPRTGQEKRSPIFTHSVWYTDTQAHYIILAPHNPGVSFTTRIEAENPPLLREVWEAWEARAFAFAPVRQTTHLEFPAVSAAGPQRTWMRSL